MNVPSIDDFDDDDETSVYHSDEQKLQVPPQKTKVEVMISSRNVVTFKVSEFLLNSINSNMNNFDERS